MRCVSLTFQEEGTRAEVKKIFRDLGKAVEELDGLNMLPKTMFDDSQREEDEEVEVVSRIQGRRGSDMLRRAREETYEPKKKEQLT